MCWFWWQKTNRYLSGKDALCRKQAAFHHHLSSPPCMYKWHVFLLTLGGFRRTTGVSRSTGRSHFFWEAMWPNKKAGSVCFSLWKTAHVDKKDYEEVWDAISPLHSPPLSLFFFYDTFFPYSLLALLTYFKLQRNSAKCLVISTFQSPFHYHFHDLFDRSSLFCSWFLVMRD